jgi:DNA-binding transcriptional LysR family regulator
VATLRSFSATSEKLFITQSAVTQQIKALETQYGVKLIHVKRKRVYLTKAGGRLVNYAEEFFNHVMMVENFLKSYRINNLQIGVACTLTLYLTPVIDKFKELYPSIRVSVREGPSLIIIDELLDFNFDICLVGTLKAPNKRLHVTSIPNVEKMVLVASPDYPLAQRTGVKLEDLVAYPLIIQSEGSVAREAILEHFRSKNLNPLIGAEVDNIECAKELARQQKGVAFMFMPNVREEVARKNLKIIPVIDGEIVLGIDIVLNQEIPLSSVTESFLSIVKKYFYFNINPVEHIIS